MSVDVAATSPALEYRTATALFEAPLDVVTTAAGNRYDVTKDGQRFLIGAPVQASTAPITVVINWWAELKQ